MRSLLQLADSISISPSDTNIPTIAADDQTVANAFSAAIIFAGAWALLFMLIGAILYVTSNGEQQKITQAKNTILYSVIGVIISALAFAIVQFVLGNIGA